MTEADRRNCLIADSRLASSDLRRCCPPALPPWIPAFLPFCLPALYASEYRNPDACPRLRASLARRRPLPVLPDLVRVGHRDDGLGLPERLRRGPPRAIAGARCGGRRAVAGAGVRRAPAHRAGG